MASSNLKISDDIASLIENKTLVNEAEFGLNYVYPYLLELKAGSKVLEVGSGAGILLSQITNEFASISFTGIEPVGPGFKKFEIYIEKLKSKFNINLQNTSYENIDINEKFDLIFLINVFEHLPDWKDFLKFIRNHLTEHGKCIILCPNYGFPYESHFSIPIIINKKITKFIFNTYIKRYEIDNYCIGLWDSLNFVKWNNVRSFAKNTGLEISFKKFIITNLIKRLDTDAEFKYRQKKIAFIARLLLKLKIVDILELKIFYGRLPYMFFEVKNVSHETF